MAPRDPARVQLDFPQLTADLIAALSLTGTVGLLEFSDLVTPVFLIGSRGIDFGGALPDFTSAGVFSGSLSAPAGNTVVVDTGALAAGTYDIQGHLSYSADTAAVGTPMSLQHRNAANNATLAELLTIPSANVFSSMTLALPLMGYVIGLNERLRVLSPSVALVAGSSVSASILMQIRPTP